MLMASVLTWVATILSAVIILIAGHISITIILPKLKDFLGPAFKDEKALYGLMTLFMVLVIVLVFKAEIDLLLTLQNETLNLINVFKPGVDLILALGKYVGYVVLVVLGVVGLKYIK